MTPEEPRIRRHFLSPRPARSPHEGALGSPGTGSEGTPGTVPASETTVGPAQVARPPEAVGRAENQVCGDVVELFLTVAGGLLVRVEHRSIGCSSARATASLVCDELEGRPLEQARSLDVERLVAESGGLPPSKAHAPRVVQRALAAALADHSSRCHPESPGSIREP